MTRKIKSKFTEEELLEIQKQVGEESIPYDYKTKDYPFEVILRKFGDENDEEATLYVPAYQREFVWKTDRSSRFIESVLLGVPLTPFLVSEDENNRLEIIDGSQRIRTLLAFHNNQFALRKLKKITLLNKAKFKDLPRRLQNAIKNRDFKVIVVSDKADLSIRQDIFDRINTSSEPLTDSEKRKGIHSGPFYVLISELAKNTDFQEICPISEDKNNRGGYEELILRFFSYVEKYKSFKHDVASFLNIYLDEMNETDFDENKYRKMFDDMVSFIKKYFELGFRKEKTSKSTPRVRFESIAVGVHLALEENPNVIPSYMDWLYSEEFTFHTTSHASNNKGKLKDRVEFVRDCILNKIKKEELTYE